MSDKDECQHCSGVDVDVYTVLCDDCQKEFLEEWYEEQDKQMQEVYEDIRRSMY